jgi:hypothetical protein
MVAVTNARTDSTVPAVGAPFPLLGSLALGAQQGKLDAGIRTSPTLGTPSIQVVHYYYPFLALEDGNRLASLVAKLIDRLVILVVIRSFPCLGVAADSRSFRSENHTRMKEFVRRSTYVPFSRFLGASRVHATIFLCFLMARLAPIFVMPCIRVVHVF